MLLADLTVDVLDVSGLATSGTRPEPIAVAVSPSGVRVLITAQGHYRTLACSPQTELLLGVQDRAGRSTGRMAITRAELEALPIVRTVPLLEFVTVPAKPRGPRDGAVLPALAHVLGAEAPPSAWRLN